MYVCMHLGCLRHELAQVVKHLIDLFVTRELHLPWWTYMQSQR